MPHRDYTEGRTALGPLVASVSVGKAASELGVSPTTVRNWIGKGYLKAVQLPSGHRRIPQPEVERLLASMFDFGVPQTEESTPLVAAKSIDPDEEWGP